MSAPVLPYLSETKPLRELLIEKKQAIENYVNWVIETKREEINKQAIEMYLICPDPEYWTDEHMKEFIVKYEKKYKKR